MPQAHCLGCKSKQEMVEAVTTETKKGQPMLKGKCGKCGRAINVFVAKAAAAAA